MVDPSILDGVSAAAGSAEASGAAGSTGGSSFSWQPISSGSGASGSSGSGFGSATNSMATAGSKVGGPMGGMVGAGIGLIADIANMWIGIKAAQKQEDQTSWLNAQSKVSYDQETTESRRRYDEQAKAAKDAADWGMYKDRVSMLGGWTSNLFAIADKDQNVKNSLVNLWRSNQ